MTDKIEFVFGTGEDKEGNLINELSKIGALLRIAARAAELFGGYTMYKAAGGWKSPEGRLVQEGAAVLFVYGPANDTARTRQLVQSIKDELNQRTIIVTTQSVNSQEL